MKLITFVLLMMSSWSMTAIAHDDILNYNQVSLVASASAEIDNDTIIVTLYAQEEGSQADMLSDSVNRQINRALDILKQYSSIDVATKDYSVQPVYSKSQIVSWRVRQSIELKTEDIDLLTAKLAELQTFLKLAQVSFDVSPERREQSTRALIDQALVAYNQRARQITETLSRKSYKIVSLDVDVPTSSTPYRHRAVASMAEASPVMAPEFAAGKNRLMVRVSGTIELE